MKDTKEHVSSIDAKFDQKVDTATMDMLLEQKLDSEIFAKAFPLNKDPQIVLQ